MCGIGGAVSLGREEIAGLRHRLAVMNRLQRHRGPDGEGVWEHPRAIAGFAHRRLSVLDLVTGQQPMTDGAGNWITYNGEIYNYRELRAELGAEQFRTQSDTEVILVAYRKWGAACVQRFRGMFAFALWDESRQELFCARDRFGIKPFYYTTSAGTFSFASEIKALLPFADAIEPDLEGLRDYIAFQFCLGGKTLFRHVRELPAGHTLRVANGHMRIERYWDVYYQPDFDHTPKYFEERLRELLAESVTLHLRSDVPVGAYLSGGLDSSAIVALASRGSEAMTAFTGKYAGEEYDESRYARIVAAAEGLRLHELEITPRDFVENIRRVVYHLDHPVAGPGSFGEFMMSGLAARHCKVVLAGQGGDEIFGGYTRYLIAYFEQCIKAAIDGTLHDGKFIVTYESIIPNLAALQNYKPLLQEFWREGLFEPMDRRYFRLINRAPARDDEIRWELLGDYSPFDTFQAIFNGTNVGKESYFDKMTHFDFKTLLPALLHVGDRASMAHGVEARVPFLDHPLVELAATMPSNVKFENGTMKQVLKNAMRGIVPETILARKDKMGFPVPLTDWLRGPARDFVREVFASRRASERDLVDNRRVLAGLDRDLEHEPKFGRRIWGLLCLELWYQEFMDKAPEYRELLAQPEESRA